MALVVEAKKDLKKINYAQQGDATMYTQVLCTVPCMQHRTRSGRRTRSRWPAARLGMWDTGDVGCTTGSARVTESPGDGRMWLPRPISTHHQARCIG